MRRCPIARERWPARRGLAALALTSALLACRQETPPTETPPPEASIPNLPAVPLTVEDEVLANIRGQSVGDATFADLDMPEPFLRRVADRVIRESYQQDFHGVFLDEPFTEPPDELRAPPGDEAPIDVRIAPTSALAELPEGRPPLPGFRAPILGGDWPFDAELSPREAETRTMVARQLARDGLALTTARAIAMLGDEAPAPATIKAVGLPLDLVDMLTLDDAPDDGRVGLTAAVRGGGDPVGVGRRARLRFRPSEAGFRIATESGEHEIAGFRVQLTRGTYWRGVPHGGSVDMLRQLLDVAPDLGALGIIESKFAPDFRRTAMNWPPTTWGQLDLIASPLPVAQWAQDNGKPGWIGGTRTTIVPRLATRREDGVVFIPGESAIAEGLADSGRRVVHSSLHFQGGNLLPVLDGATGRRILLVGEAEIHRNRVLGLSETQAREAFRAEFGVDEVRVLVTPSFHLDMDLTVRTIGPRTIAFVNDRDRAVRIVLRQSIDVLERAGFIGPEDAARSKAVFTGTAELTPEEIDFVIRELWPLVESRRDRSGRLPISFVKHFSTGARDEPIGHFHRFMLALNEVTARGLPDEAIPSAHPGRSYFRALRRARAARTEMRSTLEEWGWEIVGIPGWSEASRSLVAVNGLHGRRRYLMPAYGGWCAEVDEAAREAFQDALGPTIDVRLVHCPETQRRSGGLHCAVVAWPRSDAP